MQRSPGLRLALTLDPIVSKWEKKPEGGGALQRAEETYTEDAYVLGLVVEREAVLQLTEEVKETSNGMAVVAPPQAPDADEA